MNIDKDKIYTTTYHYDGKIIDKLLYSLSIGNDSIVYIGDKFVIGRVRMDSEFYIYSDCKINDFTEIIEIIKVYQIQ